MSPDDWRQDAAEMLEYESIYEEAKESARSLDGIDEEINLDFKKQHAPKLRDLVSYYMWSHMMGMETVSLLIQEEMISPDYNQQNVGDFLRDETVSDKFLLDILRKAEVIDHGVYSELTRIRKIRNEIAHSIRVRAMLQTDLLDLQNLETEVERAYSTFNDAQDILNRE